MRTAIIGAVLVLVAAPLAAQQRGGQGREALRQAVVERFAQNFVQQANLTEDQRGQFRQTLQQHFRQRQQLAMRRMQIIRALEDQMRPGVAADRDSVTGLLASLMDVETESAAAMRTEQEAYAAFLSPVQRGLFVIHYERLQRQIQNVQRRPGAPRGNDQRRSPGGRI